MWSRSTWACELKFFKQCMLFCTISSRSTWACELKLLNLPKMCNTFPSRSTWACELKLKSSCLAHAVIQSRSTWACELKFCIGFGGVCNASHAPRERVSWNINNLITFNRVFVTLHVSVWVEINCSGDCILSILVTLHVSVWVEIEEFYSYKHLSMSRSTWACELKLRCSNGTWTYSSHAPRERVSWNDSKQVNFPL